MGESAEPIEKIRRSPVPAKSRDTHHRNGDERGMKIVSPLWLVRTRDHERTTATFLFDSVA